MLLNNLKLERIKYISENEKNEKIINSIIRENQMYSYEMARILKFNVYDMRDYIDETLIKSLQKLFMFDRGQYITIKKHNLEKVKIDVGYFKIPKEIQYQVETAKTSTNQIDFRDHKIYDEVKKFIRFYEHTLGKELIKEGIYIYKKDKFSKRTKNILPVSRAWIKFYEILYTTRIYDFIKEDLKVFYQCEAPGTFIIITEYYLKKWNSNIRYTWDAMTLNPKLENKEALGDTYGLIKKFGERWTFGKDGTGDITKEENIKYYHNMCKNRDWIIGDCGLSFSEDKMPGVLLFYAQMLFNLYNLKEGAGCIFKQILNFDTKILIDMMYLMYLSFDKMEIYKPVQNEFSPEFYVICSKYKRILNDKDFEILFKFLKDNEILTKSFINEYKRDFIYQFTGMLEKIIRGFNNAIDRQLYYTDFWDKISNEDKDEIKRYIDIKNKDWIDYYIKRH